ncbi:MAG: sulfate ABC transporter permease [Armatimonadota bacterium]
MARGVRVVRLLLFYAALAGLWQLLYRAEFWPPYLLPAPGSVLEALQRTIDNGLLLQAVEATLRRQATGFALAFLLGTGIGLVTGTVRWADETLGTLVLGLQSLPSITWLPLAVLWFGLNEQAIIFVTLMGSIFAIATSAHDGVRSVPPLQRRAAQVLGASRWQLIRYVILPGMLPSMAQGLRLGWAFSWRSLMAGEILYVSHGLGHLLQVGRDLNDMPQVLAIMAVILAVGLTFDRLVFGPFEGWIRARWGLAEGR